MTKFRIYIDEVGNADLGSSADPNHRYLSLTGVALALAHVQDILFPALEALKKKYFGSHPDDPVILHRKELVNARGAFHVLRQHAVRTAFDEELLGVLERASYVVFTATVDKLEHVRRYRVWQFHPYHYALMVILERYVMWLETQGACGDVMAESRGTREDTKLKESFARLWERGTDFVDAQRFQHVLTSRELKVKPKTKNIAGLQLADLIAHPSFKYCLRLITGHDTLKPLGRRIAEMLVREKYYRSNDGTINGWGIKWLP